jgi:hypothetical protein
MDAERGELELRQARSPPAARQAAPPVANRFVGFGDVPDETSPSLKARQGGLQRDDFEEG